MPGQESQSNPAATKAGTAWIRRILRLTVAAPYTPAITCTSQG